MYIMAERSDIICKYWRSLHAGQIFISHFSSDFGDISDLLWGLRDEQKSIFEYMYWILIFFFLLPHWWKMMFLLSCWLAVLVRSFDVMSLNELRMDIVLPLEIRMHVCPTWFSWLLQWSRWKWLRSLIFLFFECHCSQPRKIEKWWCGTFLKDYWPL